MAVDLGHIDELRENLPFDVEFAGRPHRVVELDGRLVAHSVVCPHMLGPLFATDGDGGTLECPWHGYVFDARTGRSCDGRGLRLTVAPEVVIDERTGRCSLAPAGTLAQMGLLAGQTVNRVRGRTASVPRCPENKSKKKRATR